MSIPFRSVTFGTDAEFFLRTRTGQPFPVCGLFGGTKEKPKPIPSLGKGYYVQEDNAAVEFNIPPTGNISVFADSVHLTLSHLQQVLPKSLILDKDHASVVFNEGYLQIPEMGVFGCDPDYNAFTMCANDRPMPPVPGFRSAAAHVHIGWDKPTEEDRLELIRLADVFCSLSSVATESVDDSQRRKLYGQAGAFRYKNYGVEHRVLSNSWLKTYESIRSTLENYFLAITALNAGIKVELSDYSKIAAAINTPHLKLAETLHLKYYQELKYKVGTKTLKTVMASYAPTDPF